MEGYTFTKEKLRTYMKVSHEYLLDAKIIVGQDSDDFIEEQLTVMMEAFILQHLVETRILTYYAPRPTFFDWLLRRRKKVTYVISVKEMLKNPNNKVQRFVKIEEQ